MKERDVFINALQKNPSERSAYLDEACAETRHCGDESTRC